MLAYTIVWWVLLIVSMILILFEMTRWLRSRTIDFETWVDVPRLKPPMGEIEELAESLRSNHRSPRSLVLLKERMYHDIIERISLTLGMGEDELRRMLFNDSFLKKNFGGFTTIMSYLSGGPLGRLSVEGRGRRIFRWNDADLMFDEYGRVLEQMKRWEKKYEN
ncbi:MAG: hypothetical protein WED05_13570 [Candidatus Atabeyarchaeum deiterrae]